MQEEIDNPRMRGRKLGLLDYDIDALEEIDNPRMRGRKLRYAFRSDAGVVEEIDNPRMRGRKRNDAIAAMKAEKKKLIIPG